jgi:predicted nucleic acid-binding protein
VSPVQYLVDTSALVRLFRDPQVRARWQQQVTAGLLSVCPVTELELLYAAKSTAHRAEIVTEIDGTFCWTPMPDEVFTRASQVQAELTQRGLHRSAGTVELLVAATAQLHGLILLHYDRDFDQMAGVTGQQVEWVVPAGTVP